MSELDVQLHRDVGRIEGQVEALERRLADMQDKVDEMHRVLMRAQGGWRMLLMVGSLSAAIGAVLTKVIGWMWPR